MGRIYIPNALLGITRRLTANEVSIYQINCGPGGSWIYRQSRFQSFLSELNDYIFDLPSSIMDTDELYTLTIYKASELEENPH